MTGQKSAVTQRGGEWALTIPLSSQVEVGKNNKKTKQRGYGKMANKNQSLGRQDWGQRKMVSK